MESYPFPSEPFGVYRFWKVMTPHLLPAGKVCDPLHSVSWPDLKLPEIQIITVENCCCFVPPDKTTPRGSLGACSLDARRQGFSEVSLSRFFLRWDFLQVNVNLMRQSYGYATSRRIGTQTQSCLITPSMTHPPSLPRGHTNQTWRKF